MIWGHDDVASEGHLESVLSEYIERYNSHRPHSELDDCTPAEVEANYRHRSHAPAA